MSKFIISGFSDEIDMNTDVQFTVLNKLGIAYFEPRGIDGKNVSALTTDEAAVLKKKMDKYGIKASSIGSPIGKISINDDFDEHISKLKNVIEVAKILKAKYIRVFSFFIPEGEACEKYRDKVILRMKKMAEIAEKDDVILLHENEKGIYGDIAERCADILNTVNNRHLRAVFDPANFVQCGEKNYPEAFMLLKPYIEYMHIKDAVGEDVVPAGHGNGFICEILNELHNSGYEGFLSLEPHLGEFEGFAELEKNGKLSMSDKSGEVLFAIAYNALKILLERIEK